METPCLCLSEGHKHAARSKWHKIKTNYCSTTQLSNTRISSTDFKGSSVGDLKDVLGNSCYVLLFQKIYHGKFFLFSFEPSYTLLEIL